MRTALKNKQNLKYSLLVNEKKSYLVENGELVKTSVDGVEVAVETGYSNNVYGTPVSFIGNFIPVGSESYARGNVAVANAYGIDISAYDALLLMQADEIPVTETSVIWKTSEPTYKTIKNAVLLDANGDETSNPDNAVSVGDLTVVDENSADYVVKRVATSMHITLILLRKLNNNAYS